MEAASAALCSILVLSAVILVLSAVISGGDGLLSQSPRNPF